jgi:hypothetical protein
MPHEFTISGHNSCNPVESAKTSPLLLPTKTSSSMTGSSSGHSPILTTTTTTATAPRKPSQLGLFCTDKENGRHSGGVMSVSRSVPSLNAAPSAAKATAATPGVPKHIYDSGMKTFFSVVKFLGKVRASCTWKGLLCMYIHIREDSLLVMKLFQMLLVSILQPKLSLKHRFKNRNKKTR